MGEKKKSNANTTALIGAAFLMATSAIGPGFLTQTATFTGQYGSIFALAIICTILLDVTTQLNIWSIIGVDKISQIKLFRDSDISSRSLCLSAVWYSISVTSAAPQPVLTSYSVFR